MAAMSEQPGGNRADQDPAQRAEDLEQRYVGEHERTEELLEGLDPERPEGQQTTGEVEGVARDRNAEEHVESMSRDDP
jgi:hypothetical protein